MSRSNVKITALHRSHGRLICPEYMKKLPFVVSEQWQNFQGEVHIFKADCQNNQTMHRFHVRLIWPENMKQLPCIASEY